MTCRCEPFVEPYWGMLYLLSYAFMLRVPSEALPVVRGGIGFAHRSEHATILFMDRDHLCLKLGRRKNKFAGSLLKNACWCCQCQLTCLVHALWPFYVGAASVSSHTSCMHCGLSLKSSGLVRKHFQKFTLAKHC